mgnify:CR=1 FL=1
MAINTLEMAKLFQQSLDKQMLVGAYIRLDGSERISS